MSSLTKKITTFSFLLLLVSAKVASALLEIDITEGYSAPIPLAIKQTEADHKALEELGVKVFEVVKADLERSGLFSILPPSAFITSQAETNEKPVFANWRVINAHGLVSSRILKEGGGIRIECRLWDTITETSMLATAYKTEEKNWRRVAHKIADAIYHKLTGEEGYFDTKIVYVSETGPLNRRIKRIAIMDQDGENHSYLTGKGILVLTPRFSADNRFIAYLSYKDKEPQVYLKNLQTERDEFFGYYRGMTFAPRFSPDGTAMIMSLEMGGKTCIYKMDLHDRKLISLTPFYAIDTSPCYSPDGSKIVFTSDREGRPQLYVMNSKGQDIQRISRGEGSYTAPVWSPRGDLIAFTKKLHGQFYLGVMRSDGTGERVLTGGYLVESPSFSSNGTMLVFARQYPSSRDGKGGRTRIYTINITGFNEREVPTPLDASDPCWSAPLP